MGFWQIPNTACSGQLFKWLKTEANVFKIFNKTVCNMNELEMMSQFSCCTETLCTLTYTLSHRKHTASPLMMSKWVLLQFKLCEPRTFVVWLQNKTSQDSDMTQELDTNKHRVIYCVKFLKSTIYQTLLQSDHILKGKNKKATFFDTLCMSQSCTYHVNIFTQ